ncbi:MAG: hypothetical protein N2039_10660, partial [Gemmataceae bacterium]|nr:hypothetical protein [Gemmataceae bacterium]
MSRWIGGWIVLMSAAFGARADAVPGSRCTTDRQIIDTLARVHDQGAALFNAGDHHGCYRMFQGALATVQIVLPRDLQETVQRGLAQAELSGDVIRRALALHELIEEVRKKLHPTASQSEALPKPRPAPMEPQGTPGPLPTNPKTPEPIQPPKASPQTGLPPQSFELSTPEPPKAPAIPPRNGLTPPPPVTSSIPTSQPRPRVASDAEGKEATPSPPRSAEPVPPWDDRPAKSATATPSPAPRSGVPEPPFELDPPPAIKPKEPTTAPNSPPLNLDPPPAIKPKEP